MSLSPLSGNFSLSHTPETKEVCTPKSQVVLFSGFLGSGKTTLINNIFPHIEGKTKIIVNDIGSINIDATRFDGKDTVSLQEGCVCCEDEKSLLEALEHIKQEEQETGKPITIILEPSGIADAKTILNILKQKGFPTKTITTFDAHNFEAHKNISEEIFTHQLQVADIIGVTKSSDIPEEQKQMIEKINSSAPLISIPANDETEVFPNVWKQIQEIQTDKKTEVAQVFSLVQADESKNHSNPLISKTSEAALSKADIYLIKSYFGTTLPRAKGVLASGEHFDIVGGDIEFHIGDENQTFFTLMSAKDFDLSEVFSEIETRKNYQQSEEKIQKLVQQYDEYMELYNAKNILTTQLKNGEDTSLEITKLELELQELGEAMKYDNPYIWLKYKMEAYKNSENAIQTIGDLINHCNVPDYICGKRLAFLETYLQKEFGNSIYEFDPNTDLNIFLENNVVQQLSQDKDFIEKWLEYEYFLDAGRVAKWENYTN